jgi:hypothetical protein
MTTSTTASTRHPVSVLADVCDAIRKYFASGVRFAAEGNCSPEDLAEYIGIPLFERDVKVYRAWRQHYAETSNVRALA